MSSLAEATTLPSVVTGNSAKGVDKSSSYTWVLALIVSILSAAAYSGGDILVRYSHLKNGAATLDMEKQEKRYCSNCKELSPLWWLGIALGTLGGGLLLLIAFSIGSSTMVVIINGGGHLVILLVLARAVLSEHVSCAEYFYALLTIVGMTLVIVASARTQGDRDENMGRLIQKTPFVIWMIFLIIITIPMLVFSFIANPKLQKLKKICLPTVAGIISGISNLAIKHFGMVARHHFDLENKILIFRSGEFYLSLLVNGILIAAYLSLYNVALKIYDASFALPFILALMVLTTCISGIILFQEYMNWKNAMDYILILLGITVTIAGMIFLSIKDALEACCSRTVSSSSDHQNNKDYLMDAPSGSEQKETLLKQA